MQIDESMINYAIEQHRIGIKILQSAKELGCSDSHLSKHMRAKGYFANGKGNIHVQNTDIYTRILCSKVLGLI